MPFLAAGQRGATQGHALVQGAVVANLGGLANHHAHPVIDEHPSTDASPGMNFNAGQNTPEMRHEPAGEQPAVIPKPVGDTVIEQRVKPRITQHDLKPRSGCRIACQCRVNFFSQVLPQHRYHYINMAAANRRHPLSEAATEHIIVRQK
jgi:hypothetical protein